MKPSTSNNNIWRIVLPTLGLMAMLTLVGLYLYFFTKEPVAWPSFFSMMSFYILIFLTGAYAATLRESEDTQGFLLAGRQLPLWIAVFTMSATWIGGGYINGTAEYAASSGLVWVQAPWGYALSLVELAAHPPLVAPNISERPCASPLARHQIRQQRQVTNQRHEPVIIDNSVSQQLLPLLDGSRNQTDLVEHLANWAEPGLAAKEGLAEAVAESLQQLWQEALLVA